MILAPDVIESVRRGMRRTLALPDEDGCPVLVGHAYKLQPAMFKPGLVTITVTDVHPRDDRWLVVFVLGDWSDLYSDRPVYMTARSRDGGMRADYTTLAGRAVHEGGGAVEVAPAVPGASERARLLAIAQRTVPVSNELVALERRLGTLRDAMIGMKARGLVRTAQRTVAAAQVAVQEELAVHSEALGAVAGTDDVRPSRAGSS